MKSLEPIIVLAIWCAACAPKLDLPVYAGRYCPSGRVENFMAARAQQCWYTSPQGRWRILNHDFHYDTLVMETEASSVEAAAEVMRRLVDVHGERFSEILIYVQQDKAVRRVRWTRNAPPEYLDFTR